MRLEEFKAYQQRNLADFKKKASGPQRSEAVQEAKARLKRAGIIDDRGKLDSRYR